MPPQEVLHCSLYGLHHLHSITIHFWPPWPQIQLECGGLCSNLEGPHLMAFYKTILHSNWSLLDLARKTTWRLEFIKEKLEFEVLKYYTSYTHCDKIGFSVQKSTNVNKQLENVNKQLTLSTNSWKCKQTAENVNRRIFGPKVAVCHSVPSLSP